MDNDTKVTLIGTVKNISALLAVFGLPEIDPAYQMKIVQLVAVAYLGLGIFRDFFTNKPDAAVLDRLEAILARLKGAQ
ncbi:MAG TPA: hypothetical protein PKZ07_20655 [Sedimentisphaerales bacterium]|jgi:hypothetical protein|nr:hypothetical protein [Sedimentisphaerales bacterium]